MKDQELENILKSAQVPEPGEGFWDDLPGRVTTQCRSTGPSRNPDPEDRAGTLLKFLCLNRQSLAVCAFLALLGTAGLFWPAWRSDPLQNQAQRMRTYLLEVSALFPGQVRSIVSINGDTRIVLADSPSVPSSNPILLRIQSPNSVQTLVTFSGQEVEINGEPCEVLLAGDDKVLLLGQQRVWSSGLRTTSGEIRIEARML